MKLKLLMTAFLVVGLCSPLAYAQDGKPMLDQGTKELALSGTIELPEFEEVDFDIDASYGYFFRDGWEVGMRALGSDVGGAERFDFSLFTEYNFRRNTNIVPYIGTSVGLATVDFENFDVDSTLTPNDEDSTVFGVQAGLKWFMRPYMAITTAINFTVSTDDIYLADNELQDNLTRFRIGLRYYF